MYRCAGLSCALLTDAHAGKGTRSDAQKLPGPLLRSGYVDGTLLVRQDWSSCWRLVIDFDEISEYCRLSRKQIEDVCKELGFAETCEFSNSYEGLWSESELIKKQQDFYDENELGDYLSLHDPSDYLCVPDGNDSSRMHWFSRPFV